MAPQAPTRGHLGLIQGRPRLQIHMSREAAQAAAAIKAAKAQRPFKKPSEDALKEIAQVAVFNLLGPELPPWSDSVEEAVLGALKAEVEKFVGGKYMRAKAIRELLMQAAKRHLDKTEPQMRFQPASDEMVNIIASMVAQRRRPSAHISNLNRVLNVYCAACLGYTGKGVVATYLFLQLQRRMEKMKNGPYVRMGRLYETLEIGAEEELSAIETLLTEVARSSGGGRKLRKWESPRGYEAYEVTIRYKRMRKCYLIVDSSTGQPHVVALKDAHDFRRNLRKRFNRNAERSYSNVPPKLRHR